MRETIADELSLAAKMQRMEIRMRGLSATATCTNGYPLGRPAVLRHGLRLDVPADQVPQSGRRGR